MRSNLLTVAAAIALLFCVQTPSFAQGVPIGVQGSVPICTHAQLHAGTCQLAQPGYTATITNGDAGEANACAPAAATGSDQITCRYITGTGWEEFEPGAGGGGGDLGTTATGAALTITNTGGTNASIPAATSTTWGALTDEDKTKLDGVGRITDLAGLQAFIAGGQGSAYIDTDIVANTDGAIAATTIFPLLFPDDGSLVDLRLEFRDGAALIWNHTGVEPAGAITIATLDQGNGNQADGSRIEIRYPRMFERRSGVLGGSATTSVQGFTTINRAVSGESKMTYHFVQPEFRTRSAGSSSIVFGHNPSGPATYYVEGGILDGPLGFDGKFICAPTDCKRAGATLVGTHIIGSGANPRCFKSDFQSNLAFIGGSWTTCYGDAQGTGAGSSIYMDGVVGKAMPPTLAGNDGVFVMSGVSNLKGSMLLAGAGPSSADIEALVLINSGFLGSYDLEATALDCASRFWFNPAGDSASGWLRVNTSPATGYGSGRVVINGPSGTAGAECGPRDLVTNAADIAAERDNGIPLILSAGAKRVAVNTNDIISRMPAAFAGDCQNREHGFTVTITDDTAVGACTDAGADGVLDGGGSSVSTCRCNPAGNGGQGAWDPF